MKSKQQKQTEAAQRQRATDLLSPRERLQVLDSRLGVGVGAAKERSRLHNLAAKSQVQP